MQGRQGQISKCRWSNTFTVATSFEIKSLKQMEWLKCILFGDDGKISSSEEDLVKQRQEVDAVTDSVTAPK